MKKLLLIFFLPILLFAQPSNKSLFTRDTSWVATQYWVTSQGYMTSATLGTKLDTTLATAILRTNWSTAYTDRLKWDGGATGLVAATGRTSLGLGTMALTDSVYIKSLIALKLNIADSTIYATQGDLTTGLAGKVSASLYDANSILYATSDNTPVALTVGASTIVGRKSSGDIVALTATETRTILNVADGANVGVLPTSILRAAKTTPEIVSNSTTLQDDNALTLAVEANSTYIVEMELIVVANSTSKFKARPTYPSGSTYVLELLYTTTASGSYGNISVDQTTNMIDGNPQAADSKFSASGTLVTSSTAGSFTLQWAQSTAEVYNTYVYTGSSLKLTKVD